MTTEFNELIFEISNKLGQLLVHKELSNTDVKKIHELYYYMHDLAVSYDHAEDEEC